MKGERAIRYDHGELSPPVRTPQGFLRVEGYVSRPGIYEYINKPEDEAKGYGKAGTIRRELRPEEEVFREDSLGAFEGVSLTARHPGRLITAENARTFEVGTVVARARRSGNRVAASIIIKDPKTIASVEERKLNKLSPGYLSTIYKTPGFDKRYATARNPEGRYDVIQRDINPNHLALCEDARGGNDLEVRLDSVDDVAVEVREDGFAKLTSAVDGHQHLIDTNGSTLYGGDGMSGCTSWAVAEGADGGHEHPWVKNPDGSITIGESAGHKHTILDENRYSAARPVERNDAADIPRGGTAMDLEEQVRLLQAKVAELEARAVKAENTAKEQAVRADSADARAQTLSETLAETEAKLAAGHAAAESKAVKDVQTRLDAKERELADLEAAIPGRVQKRADLIVKARAVMGNEYRCDSLDDRSIREAIIRRLRPREQLSAETSNATIEARCDSLCEERMKNATDLVRTGEVLTRETRTDSVQPTQPTSYRDAWKNGAGEFATAKKGA